MKPKFRSILSGIAGISLALLLGVLPAYAQRPEIISFEPKQASYGHSVTIKGNNFGTDKTKLAVRFGSAQASITTISNQQLQVNVPAGATHDNLSVTHLTSGLTGYSREQFFINFHGDGSGFALTNLQGQFDFPAAASVSTEGLFDLCMCDFDGDGLNDVATAKQSVQSIEYYMNASTGPGVINFTKNSTGTSYPLRYVKCGDLNGDGKPEIIATDAISAGRILIFKNNSTPGAVSFSSVPVINLAPRSPKRIEIADLDLDGKPELIFTDESAPPIVTILKNESTISSIAFSTTPLTIPLPYDPNKAIPSSNALAAQDIDGDNLPEIVVSPFLSSDNSIIYLIKNKSTAGTLSLTDITPITTNSILADLRVGDIDSDGKPDIAYTTSSPSRIVAVVLNQSTSSTLAFSSPTTISGGTSTPFGLDLGDIDGDGKLDVVAASDTKASIQILINKSTAGTASFTEFVKTPTNSNNRHVVVGDVDNDGKPDIAFTSTDIVSLGVKASKVAILRNSVCMKPEVEPAGPLNVCTGNTDVVLTATLGGGVTYDWTNATTGLTTTTPGNVYTPTVDGNYYVTAKSIDCDPDPTSNTVVFTTSASAPYAAPAPAVPPACIGSPLQFTTTNQGAGYGYEWTGPAGFTSSVREPLIPSATADNAGDYTVSIKAPSGCVLGTATVTAVVRFPPSFIVGDTPPSNIECGSTVPGYVLKVSPVDTDYTYDWYLNGALKASNVTQLTMTNPGEYHYIAKSINSCADVESNHYTFKLLEFPTALFAMQGSACQGEEVQMDNQSTTTSADPLFYSWLITNDGRTSDQEQPVFTFPNAATYNVKLTVSYANGTCATDNSQSISIVGTGLAPLVITNPDNTYQICQDGELKLQATTGFSSYEWSVAGETGESITVSEAGEYSVKAEAPSGCIVTAKRTITEIQGPIVEANATPPVIDEGEQTQLSVTHLVDYAWEPAETLSDPTIAQPTATPLASTSYTVSGKDDTGCLRHASVLVEVRGSSITNKLIPANFFSPNSDDQNQYWMVGLIDQYPQCNVTIYDDKGVKVFNSKPYQNNWDGTFNGKPLPQGVYYFIIRCDGEENKARTGSITMMR